MDEKELVKTLVAAILVIAALMYLFSVVQAGTASVADPHVVPTGRTEPEETPILDPFRQAILLIGAALATHLGTLLGIEVKTKGWAPDSLARGSWWTTLTWKQRLRWGAALLYLVSLVLGVIFWAMDGFSPYSAGVIRDMWYTLLGIGAGVLASLQSE